VAQYVVSPPIAVRRIDRYDGKRSRIMTLAPYDRWSMQPVDVATFIGDGAHTVAKGFKRIRYYGVQPRRRCQGESDDPRGLSQGGGDGPGRGADHRRSPIGNGRAKHGAGPPDLSALSAMKGSMAYLAPDLGVIYVRRESAL